MKENPCAHGESRKVDSTPVVLAGRHFWSLPLWLTANTILGETSYFSLPVLYSRAVMLLQGFSSPGPCCRFPNARAWHPYHACWAEARPGRGPAVGPGCGELEPGPAVASLGLGLVALG